MYVYVDVLWLTFNSNLPAPQFLFKAYSMSNNIEG